MGNAGQQMGQAQGLYNTAPERCRGCKTPVYSPQLAEYQEQVQQEPHRQPMPTITG